MTKSFLIAGTAFLALGGVGIAQTTAPAANEPAATTPDAPAADMSTDTGAAKDAMTTDTTTTARDTTADATAPAPAADATATDATTADSATSTAQARPGATPDAPAPAQTASAGTTSAAVQAEWAKYDKGNKGSLTPLEFGEWVMAANGQDLTSQVASTRTSKKANLPAIKVLNATSTAFAKADTNKDRSVSPDELTTFLNG